MTNRVDRTLVHLHGRVRRSALALRLVTGTRILLAVGFIPTGMVKLLGHPFTTLDPTEGIGLFFHALHQSGAYWRFLGGAQVTAALLVLIPPTYTLGAALFFPIILNIFIITVSLDFRGTPFVTGPMLLASLLLLAWDYHRWRGILFRGPATPPAPSPSPLSRLEKICYATAAGSGLLFFAGLRGALLPGAWAWFALAALAAATAVCLGLSTAFRSRRSARKT